MRSAALRRWVSPALRVNPPSHPATQPTGQLELVDFPDLGYMIVSFTSGARAFPNWTRPSRGVRPRRTEGGR
jgi:hypothetical protein